MSSAIARRGSAKTRAYAPVVLDAQAVINAQGASVPVDGSKLTNSYDNPMLVTSIVFNVATPLSGVEYGGTFGVLRPIIDYLSIVRCRLQLGRYDITNGCNKSTYPGFVPLWMLGAARNIDTSESVPGTLTNIIIASPRLFFTQLYCSIEWKLPRPLYLPVGAGLKCNLIASTDDNAVAQVGNTFPLTVDVGLHGVLLPNSERPKSMDVPFVGCWVGNEAAGSFQSDEQDLRNGTGKVLHVQRFIGRMQTWCPTGTFAQPWVAQDVLGSSYPGLSPSYVLADNVFDYGNVQIRDHDWNALTSGPDSTPDIPFNQVFQPDTRAWTYGEDLENNEHFTVRCIPAFKGAATSNGSVLSAKPMVSIVGWHAEEVAW